MAVNMDIDVDMDLDIDTEVDYSVTEFQPQTQTQPSRTAPESFPQSDTEPVPQKLYVKGLDNLTESDLKAYASEYASGLPFDRVEWIDDNSANLVYDTQELALDALRLFVTQDISDTSQLALLQFRSAKAFPAHPETRLEIRLAVTGDRKQAGARDRSRFYLFNPEYDPAERRKRDGYGRRDGRKYRNRDWDDYRTRGRQSREEFDETLYDDDDASRAIRASKSHSRDNSRSSLESGGYRAERDRGQRRTSTKELFPDRIGRREGGRLRDRHRSASPTNDEGRLKRSDSESGSTANRLKAQMIKARLKEAAPKPKELFPQKASIIHRRSDAFDAADITAELFSKKMTVPLFDGSSDLPSKQRDLISRITAPKLEDRISPANPGNGGLNIRGTASQQPAIEFSIKGRASAASVESKSKELFPNRAGQNSGKELFSEKLEGRGGRRQKAEDMFY